MSDNLFSEDWAIVATVDPDAYAAGTQNTDEIDMALWEQVAFVVMLGNKGAGATVAFDAQSSATSGGTFANISGKAITDVTNPSPNTGNDDTQYVLHLRGEEVTSNQRYVRGALVVSGSPSGNSDLAVIAFGKRRHGPAKDNDLSSVSEIVN